MEESPVSQWVEGYRSEDGKVETHHLDGVEWWNAPVPRRWHRCAPQTRGWINYFSLVERCACGAIRLDGRTHWMDRNNRGVTK